MPKSKFLCRVATTFDASGALDEDAFRAHLGRLADSGIGVILASTGSGEGGALSPTELDAVYRIGVEVCGGKVTVNSNQPEEFTADRSIEQARIAMAAGVDALNIYGPNGLHGYAATEREYERYFDRVLGAIDYPVTLCPNPVIGYEPAPATTAALANRYHQVTDIVLSGRMYDDSYYLALREVVREDVGIYVNTPGSMNLLALGAAGLEAPYANIIPQTCAAYVSSFQTGDIPTAARRYAEIRRFSAFVNSWSQPTPRWIKAAMRVLQLPGGGGGVREPFLMWEGPELDRFAVQLTALEIDEIQSMARAAA